MSPELSSLLLRSALLLAACATLLWLVSLWRRDASIADPFWGTGFLLVTLLGALTGPRTPRALLTLACVAAWALRLSMYLLRRNLGHGEDLRYVAMRQGQGARFWWVSLFSVFYLQGLLLWIVSLPLQAATSAGPTLSSFGAGPWGAPLGGPLGLLDVLGVLLFVAGLGLEALADAQLAAFKADLGSRGKVLDSGLWRYSRHPNYFGEALLWCGLACFGLATGALFTLVSPLLMIFLLTRVSGVPLLEKGLAARRPGYAEYVRKTSSFILWWPKA